MHVLALEN